MVDTNILLTFLSLPFISAIAIFALNKTAGKLRELLSVFVSLAVFLIAVFIFVCLPDGGVGFGFNIGLPWIVNLNIDWLSSFLVMLISFIGCLAVVYSVGYMRLHKGLRRYYPFLLLFIGSMNGAVIAGDLLTMFFFWELMSLFAFFLIIFDGDNIAVAAGAKYLIMSGAGSLCMLFAIGFLFFSQGSADISVISGLATYPDKTTFVVMVLFIIGLGVKAGMVPLHTWLPDAHPAAPSPVSALLSGVMIKVAIYWMFKVFILMFGFSNIWQFTLCALGSITIIIGVMMALVQSDIKRLLAYHSVSQIGYMILGIGTGVGVGMFGGLFHLLNHALFKGLLFLGAGALIYRTKTRDLDKYGGLLKAMPITFITCLIAALSISGVPPFNGFVSKWMIYQGVIEAGAGHGLGMSWGWWIFLTAAVFGSALTLASFIKVIFSAFFGEQPSALKNLNIKEVCASMYAPLIILAALCVVFGVFPQIPLKYFFKMGVASIPGAVILNGIWNPTLATMLVLAGVVLGVIVYLLSSARMRTEEIFIGGEKLDSENIRIPGATMYNTIKEMKYFSGIYKTAAAGGFDLYLYGLDWARRISQQIYFGIDGTIDKLYDSLGKITGVFGGFILNHSSKITAILGGVLIISIAVSSAVMLRSAAVFIMIFYALMAISENRITKFIIWCALSQLGYAILGLGLPQAASATILYMATALVGWSLMIISLFHLRRNNKADDINKLAGAAERNPFMTVIFIIGGFGLAGLPPLFGFIGKFDLSSAGLAVNPVYSFIIAITALLTCAYVLKISKILLQKD
ncbi:MAG: NADH-quinone oxidoreductase subunit M [Elusimicrobia bacterium]|nr:NADH-quinone oxidoreductase subunit M [Elusimicrobiota bacterium]